MRALRPPRARLVPALGSLAAAAAVGAYALGLGGRFLPVTEALVPVGLAVLALGLVLRWPGTVPWAVALVGTGYVLSRSGHLTVDGLSAVVGTALLLAAELASWSIEHDARIHEERAVLVRRVATLAVLVVLALLLNVVVVGAAAVAAPAGLLLAAVGVAAAVAAVAVVVRLVRAA
jgi:hypothetical protein